MTSMQIETRQNDLEQKNYERLKALNTQLEQRCVEHRKADLDAKRKLLAYEEMNVSLHYILLSMRSRFFSLE